MVNEKAILKLLTTSIGDIILYLEDAIVKYDNAKNEFVNRQDWDNAAAARDETDKCKKQLNSVKRLLMEIEMEIYDNH